MADPRIGPELVARVRAAWPDLLAAVEGGANIQKAIEAQGLKRAWIRAFKTSEPNARQEWEDAREHSADAFTDEGLDIARNPVKIIVPGEPGNETGKEPLIIRIDAAFARAQMDYLKWIAAKRNPRGYSDKAQLDINVKTVDLTRIISEANARLARGRQPVTLEHEPTALLGHAADAAIAHSASKLLELL